MKRRHRRGHALRRRYGHGRGHPYYVVVESRSGMTVRGEGPFSILSKAETAADNVSRSGIPAHVEVRRVG